MSKKKNQPNDEIVKILKSGDITRIYFNEFAIGASKNDIFILLRRNGREEAIVNASHLAAKSLAIAIKEALNEMGMDLEEETSEDVESE